MAIFRCHFLRLRLCPPRRRAETSTRLQLVKNAYRSGSCERAKIHIYLDLAPHIHTVGSGRVAAVWEPWYGRVHYSRCARESRTNQRRRNEEKRGHASRLLGGRRQEMRLAAGTGPDPFAAGFLPWALFHLGAVKLDRGRKIRLGC